MSPDLLAAVAALCPASNEEDDRLTDIELLNAQPAVLMRLPEGVPEELPVACAGRLGIMAVRSQTVTFGGQAMSASRFEAVCGKGDAKKWKSSLWAATPEGIPEQVRESLSMLLGAQDIDKVLSQEHLAAVCCHMAELLSYLIQA